MGLKESGVQILAGVDLVKGTHLTSSALTGRQNLFGPCSRGVALGCRVKAPLARKKRRKAGDKVMVAAP